MTLQVIDTDTGEALTADSRAAWLEARKRGVGASDSPILMRSVSYQSPIGLWGIKTGRLADDQDENERMLWGQRLEPLVAEEYERRTGREIVRWGELLQSEFEPFMLATPDYNWDGIPVEIKTTDASRKSDWADGPPEHVNIQCQHQMYVTGSPMASVGVLVGGNTFMWCDVERDDEMIAEIVETARSFWRHVVDNTP